MLLLQKIYNGEKLLKYVGDSQPITLDDSGQPIQRRGVVTYSNHVSAADDPVAIVSLIPNSFLTQKRFLR
jgi:hypothetical protein